MIIDCHCHVGVGAGFSGPWEISADLKTYLARAREAGIAKTVVFSVLRDDTKEANHQVARTVAAYPKRLMPFVLVHSRLDRGRIMSLCHHFIGGEKFRGIKVHAKQAPLTREICMVAHALRVPILYDVYSDAASIDLFAREFPAVVFIIPHLGSFADNWRAHVVTIEMMRKYPNVFADTSGVKRFDYLVEAVHRAGARKLLFGSDGPWIHPGVELQKLRLLHLKPKPLRAVLGLNCLQILAGKPLSAF